MIFIAHIFFRSQSAQSCLNFLLQYNLKERWMTFFSILGKSQFDADKTVQTTFFLYI